jgi:hypothetical protein
MYRLLLPPFIFLVFLLLSDPFHTYSQQHISGVVTDAENKEPLPFATVKLGNTAEGTVTDLNGKFSINTTADIRSIQVSYLGYESRNVPLPDQGTQQLQVALQPQQGSLNEVLITPPYEKIAYILDRTINNREIHRPENYDWYRCHVYYKMLADLEMPDSLLRKESYAKLAGHIEGHHLIASETYSIRTYERPQKLQEEVIGSRFSGWQKAPFISLVTDMLPFDAYSNYFKLNGKDYPNPVSRGWKTNYEFSIVDELQQGRDTLYILSFWPKKGKEPDALRGTVYINSGNFPIAYFTATANEANLGRTIKMEQQYQLSEGKWFPQQLNYEVRWRNFMNDKKKSMDLIMTGISRIDSLEWQKRPRFKFNKARTVLLSKGADELSDSSWQKLRPEALTVKEQATYQFMDSVVDASGLTGFFSNMDKFAEGKIPVSIIDINFSRLYSYNGYEKTRLGLGLQTNEKLFKSASVGGWAGYGFGDKAWKYGLFGEVYLDPYKDKTFRAGYENNLIDPGRMMIHKDIDRSYLQLWLMLRADKVESYYANFNARMGYYDIGIGAQYQKITPMYDYTFTTDEGAALRTFESREVSVSLRYAYGERRAPVFNRYYNMGSKYPIAYLKVTGGTIEGEHYKNGYVQGLAAVSWSKHINRIGTESFLLTGGYTHSEEGLPLSRLFAGRGFLNKSYPLAVFGAFSTMRPYDYYSDRFFAASWRHDFNWRLYSFKSISRPYIGIVYNFLVGSLDNKQAHKNVAFSEPSKSYNETGIMLNDLVRLKYLGLAYISFNAGYFYHWTDEIDLKKNGQFNFGIGVTL